MNVTGDRYQSYGTVATTPWAMKAAIGLLSDAVPIFGYHKRSYIVIVSAIGTVALAVLGFVPLSYRFATIASLLLLVVNLQVATVDLLTEGKYAELMVRRPETGSDLVSYAWGLASIGQLFGSIVSGPMADFLNPRYIFLVALPLSAHVIVPVIAGWFPEERLPPENRAVRYDKLTSHKSLVKLSIAMTIGAVVVGMSALGTGKVQSVLSVSVAILLAILGFVWLPNTLRKANLYLFLANMLYITINGALDYWFIADDNCVLGGPHFSFTYYNTYANLVASVASVIGVALFQRYLSRGKFRVAFWATGLIKLAASMFDYAMVKRYNKKFGIPDKAFFMMGDAIITPVVGMLELMPAVVLTSKVCPPGMEASVYALLASYQNLGAAVSRTIGVALIDFMNIQTTAPCNFDALPNLIIVAHVLVPALSFPLVFILIPDARMTDNLIEANDNSPPTEFEPVPLKDPEDDSDDTDKGFRGTVQEEDGTPVVEPLGLKSVTGNADDIPLIESASTNNILSTDQQLEQLGEVVREPRDSSSKTIT